jgi:uncharacterized membrane protein
MTEEISKNSSPRAVSDTGLALIVYILYLAGFLTVITAIIGVIIAYIQSDTADPIARSHFQFQIRTFWIFLLYVVIGLALTVVGIGVLILLWSLVWSIVRNIKGILALNENKPIADPKSWMFG